MAISMAGSHGQSMQEKIARLGLTPRQQDLNRKWAFYKTQQYDTRMTTWDGHRVMSELEKESAAYSQIMPAGFWDPGGRFDEVPLSMRRPSAPYHLTRVVVNRFTEILFSAEMHPQVQIIGAPNAQPWLDALIKAARTWIRFAYARTFGGGMGSVCVTFQFRRGRPFIEVHDTRWCFPTFSDRVTGDLSALEIRYQYPQTELDAQGVPQEVFYWYRRIITTTNDTVYEPAPVGDGEEPEWVVQNDIAHGLDEFPGVWIRNTQTDDQDGEADCEGAFDVQEAIDTLLSQGTQGAIENCDPTLAVASDELDTADLKKGSFNGIKTEKGGSAAYVEMSGSGTQAAISMFEVHRKNFLEVVQCVLETESNAATATEIERRYSSMHSRGSMFREQYGELGIKPLLARMIRAIEKLKAGHVDPATNQVVVNEVILFGNDKDGRPVRLETPAELANLDESMIEIKWPAWVKRGPADAQAAAGAVATARTAGALDQESAVRYVSPFFNVDDATKAVQALGAEAQREQDAMLSSELLAARQRDGAQQPIDPNAGKQQNVQQTALNGAQVEAALTICTQVATGEIMPEAAIEMLIEFGLVDDINVAKRIVTAQTKAKPPAPSGPPFGGGFGGPPGGGGPPSSPPPGNGPPAT